MEDQEPHQLDVWEILEALERDQELKAILQEKYFSSWANLKAHEAAERRRLGHLPSA